MKRGNMKKIKARLHGYDPVYDRLDRKALIEHYKKVFDVDEEDLQLESRSDLIDALLDYESEVYFETSEEPEDYPLRRPEEIWGLASSLSREDGQRLYWCWEEDHGPAVRALVTNVADYPWSLIEGIRENDLILTALNSTPPLIVSLEAATSVVNGKVFVERIATFSNPVALAEVENIIDASLPRESAKLDNGVADKVLSIMAELTSDPRPVFVEAGTCPPLDSAEATSSLAVTALLQEGPVDDIVYAACARIEPPTLEPHFFRLRVEPLLLEIQDHVDDIALLCSDCHQIAHRPSLEKLRAFAAAPSCPNCGTRNPKSIIWGMPAGPPDDDKEVLGGCALPPGIRPEWSCRDSETNYVVVEFHERLGVTYVDSHGTPVD